jgi:hypothetical protein
MTPQERVTELTQKMPRRKLYAIFAKAVVSLDKLMSALARASRIPDRSGKARPIVCVGPFD